MKQIIEERVSQSLPNQVNDFNPGYGKPLALSRTCRNPFQTRSTTSIRGFRLNWRGRMERVAIPSKPGQRLQSIEKLREEISQSLSQSLPNQVNDFNAETVAAMKEGGVSQSLPNQVNDFNTASRSKGRSTQKVVAIPSKPGQRLQ